MTTKRTYDHDRAEKLSEDFPESPPADFEGEVEEDLHVAITTNATARRAGSILSQLDKNDIDALVVALNPTAKKIRWYVSRYKLMQDKIWYLSDEHDKLLKQMEKMRRRLEELGEKRFY